MVSQESLFHMGLVVPWTRRSLNPCLSLSTGFHKVMEGVHKAIELGYKPVKVSICHPC